MEFDEGHQEQNQLKKRRRPRTELLVTHRFRGEAGGGREAKKTNKLLH